MTQKQPKKRRRRKPERGKCAQRERVECEIGEIELALSRLHLLAEKELVARKGYEGYLV